MCLNLVTNLSFKIIPSLKPSRPLSIVIMTDLVTAKESIINDLVTAKDGVAKHPYSNNETSSMCYNSENT
jgi:hypothetical protein